MTVDTVLVALITQAHLKNFQGTAPDGWKVIYFRQGRSDMHKTSPFGPVSSILFLDRNFFINTVSSSKTPHRAPALVLCKKKIPLL
jgi:hypothetical protein